MPDEWLGEVAEYGFRLGAPLGQATLSHSRTDGNASVWRRAFASGTRTREFDGGNGNGTIWWANGLMQVGGTASVDPTVVRSTVGCVWETDKPAGGV